MGHNISTYPVVTSSYRQISTQVPRPGKYPRNRRNLTRLSKESFAVFTAHGKGIETTLTQNRLVGDDEMPVMSSSALCENMSYQPRSVDD